MIQYKNKFIHKQLTCNVELYPKRNIFMHDTYSHQFKNTIQTPHVALMHKNLHNNNHYLANEISKILSINLDSR